MYVSVALLQQATFNSEFSLPRSPGQSIIEYVERELERRTQYVAEKIKSALAVVHQDNANSECLFFVLPEFFWNVPWSAVASREELLALSDTCFERISECVSHLLDSFPVSTHGHLAVLAGTCATLAEVESTTGTHFEVINYLLAGSNASQNALGKSSLVMWPKRYVSGIDFGNNKKGDSNYWFFELAEGVTIKVKNKSSSLAESNTAAGYRTIFKNDFVERCPISIDLCLDYAVVGNQERENEYTDWNSKLDFLIACGMEFDREKQHLESLQFAFRNDGMGAGMCEAVTVVNGRITNKLPTVRVDNNIHMVHINVA